MTDKPKAATDPHHVLPIFVNTVVGHGHFNGVANITFGVFQFTPKGVADIDPDPIINCRLRMDLNCVSQLRDACDLIIQQNLKPASGTTH